MKLLRIFFCAIGVSISVAGCFSLNSDGVIGALKDRDRLDGTKVSIVGRLKSSHGYFNIFSKDGKECIGLLMTDEQRIASKALDGRFVTVTGTFESEGCGKKGFCVEHICSPDILEKITIINSM